MTDLTVADLNVTINHEPRIADVRLGEALGFDRPRKIRELVERHRDPLERFGPIPRDKLAATLALPPHGGAVRDVKGDEEDALTPHRGALRGRSRAVEAFWLNRRQALYLCTKSETERATEVTIEMVEVFDAYLRGQLAPRPMSPDDLTRTQRAQIARRAVQILRPLFQSLQRAMEEALIHRIAEFLASGRLPDITRLDAEIPEISGLPAVVPATRYLSPEGEVTFAEFRAALHGARLAGRAGVGAVYIDDELIMFESTDASVDGDTVHIDGKMYGRIGVPPRDL